MVNATFGLKISFFDRKYVIAEIRLFQKAKVSHNRMTLYVRYTPMSKGVRRLLRYDILVLSRTIYLNFAFILTNYQCYLYRLRSDV